MDERLRVHLHATSLVELDRALSIADRQLARGRIMDARRAIATCVQITRSLDGLGPTATDAAPARTTPGNVIPLTPAHRPAPTDKPALAPVNGKPPLKPGIVPRVIQRLHDRRQSKRRVDIDSQVPSVAECIDEWVRWQA